MKPTIMTARITDQHLQLVNEKLIASGGVDVVQIRFEFCGLWDGCGRTAVFYRDPDTVYHVPIADGLATVPHEVLATEGFFYFGVIGAASNIRTTEVIKVRVARGAITTATAEPGDPTPDIYQQLLYHYGVTEARLSQLIAMTGTAGEQWFHISGEYITDGKIKINGADAALSFKIDGLTLSAYGEHSTDGCIQPDHAPLFPVDGDIPLYCDNPALDVVLKKGENDGDWAYIKIINKLNEMIHVFGASCTGFFALSSVTVPEMVDAHVDYTGKTWPTLGDHLRGVGAALDEKVEDLEIELTEQVDSVVKLFPLQTNKIANGAVVPEKTNFVETTVSGATRVDSLLCPAGVSERIPVQGGQLYFICNDLGSSDFHNASLLCYDASGDQIRESLFWELEPAVVTGYSEGYLFCAPAECTAIAIDRGSSVSEMQVGMSICLVDQELRIPDMKVGTDNLDDAAVTMGKLADDVKLAIAAGGGGGLDLSGYYTIPETDAAIRDAMYDVVDATADSGGNYWVNGVALHIENGEAHVGSTYGGTASAGWSSEELIIPAYIRTPDGKDYKVTAIGESSLVNNSLTNAPEYREARVYIPNTITKFGANCFEQYYGEAGGHLYIVADGVTPSGYDANTTTVYDLSDPFRVVDTDKKMGDIDTALDTILAIQAELIGGDA